MGKKTDTAITNPDGAFTLRYESSMPVNTRDRIRLSVHEAAADSLYWSISDDLVVSNDTSSAKVNVYRFPRVTLANGEALNGNFYLPRFGKNGINGLEEFLTSELRYPDEARENGTQGKVLVRFLIDSTGIVQSPQIMRSAGYALDQEVLRFTGKMPAWIPGALDGKRTAMYTYLPITFRLD
jgi:TonB family protein